MCKKLTRTIALRILPVSCALLMTTPSVLAGADGGGYLPAMHGNNPQPIEIPPDNPVELPKDPGDIWSILEDDVDQLAIPPFSAVHGIRSMVQGDLDQPAIPPFSGPKAPWEHIDSSETLVNHLGQSMQALSGGEIPSPGVLPLLGVAYLAGRGRRRRR